MYCYHCRRYYYCYYCHCHLSFTNIFVTDLCNNTNNIFPYFCSVPVLLSCLVCFTFVFLPFSVIIIMVPSLSSHFLSCFCFCSFVSCSVLLYLALSFCILFCSCLVSSSLVLFLPTCLCRVLCGKKIIIHNITMSTGR